MEVMEKALFTSRALPLVCSIGSKPEDTKNLPTVQFRTAEDIKEFLKANTRTIPISTMAFLALPKENKAGGPSQKMHKGGKNIVCAVLEGGNRGDEHVTARTMITYDVDHGLTAEKVQSIIDNAPYKCFIYYTASSTPEAPRIRVFVPLATDFLKRPAETKEEFQERYRVFVQRLAVDFDFPPLDKVSWTLSQCMYLPTHCMDAANREVIEAGGDWINPDEYLEQHPEAVPVTLSTDTKKTASKTAPRPAGADQSTPKGEDDPRDPATVAADPEEQALKEAMKKHFNRENPRTLKGAIGAFNRVYYPVTTVIDAFLKEVYAPTSKANRYDLIAGEGSGGLVIYDGGDYAYSFHSNHDPAAGHCRSAFDLCRVHLFPRQAGESDKGYEKRSRDEMLEIARKDAKVTSEMQANRQRTRQANKTLDIEALPEDVQAVFVSDPEYDYQRDIARIIAGSVAQGVEDEEGIKAALAAWCAQTGAILPDEEIERGLLLWREYAIGAKNGPLLMTGIALASYPLKPIINYNEQKLADVFVSIFSEYLIYDNGYYVYDGVKWTAAYSDTVDQSLMNGLYWAYDSQVNAQIKALKEKKTGDTTADAGIDNAISYMEGFISWLGRIGVEQNALRAARANLALETEWNKDGWLLGTPEGVIDFNIFRRMPKEEQAAFMSDPERFNRLLTPSRPDMHITLTTAAGIRGWNKTTEWNTTIHEIMDEAGTESTPETDWTQLLMGYTLLGVHTQPCVTFVQGIGGSGKTTMCKSIADTLGDYTATLDDEAITVQARKDRFGLAGIEGRRYVIVSEVSKGARVDMTTLKRLSGGEQVKIRHMYREGETEQVQTWHLSMEVNEFPQMDDADSAFKERFRVINCDHHFRTTSAEKSMLMNTLPEKCGPEILAWLVDGCLRFIYGGCILPQQHPPRAARARDMAFASISPLEIFAAEWCQYGDFISLHTSFTDMYRAYAKFCQDNKYTVIRDPRVFNNIMKREFEWQSHIVHGVGEWLGVAPAPELLGHPEGVQMDIDANAINR